MPKQYVVLGRPVPPLGPRRVSVLLVCLAVLAVLGLLCKLPFGSAPIGPPFQMADGQLGLPQSLRTPWINYLNPWKQPSHPPPRQRNDTDGESHWYSNRMWFLMPFSSSVTLDENRSLLPDLVRRTRIYCYYDNTVAKDAASKDAESDLLLIWRRAWWAHGFEPIILSPAEAMKNPRYEEVQRLEMGMHMDPALRTALMRWLAWEKMGGGLLADHLLFPMGPHHDPLLSHLRRAEFPALERWKDVDEGLFAGAKSDIAKLLQSALGSARLKTAKSFLSVVELSTEDSPFQLNPAPSSLAYYNPAVVATKYPKVVDAAELSSAALLRKMAQLVTAHLHLTWQNVFSDGIAVLKPLPRHSTHMIGPARALAERLVRCPASPLPSSCPPNLPSCRPCVATAPMDITTPSNYWNTSTVYTIGTVPHPYTTALLTTLREHLDIGWIRRLSARDTWLRDLTRGLLGSGMSEAIRILLFKEAVASDWGAARSLWLAAETATEIADGAHLHDLDWHFGFAIPSDDTAADPGLSASPVPGSEPRRPPARPEDGPAPDPEVLKREPALLARARAVVLADARGKLSLVGTAGGVARATDEDRRMRDAVEAWNLADTEAWKFARAHLARRAVERRKWEEEEAKYAGGAGADREQRPEGAGGWARWD